MKGSLGNLMKQAQNMQANMEKMQAEIANLEISGESGGGMVSVVMTGRHDVRRVNIDASLLEEADKEMLEDLIAAAVNDAVQKVEHLTKEKMQGLTAGLGLPDGFKLPF